jgi:hypothetical protein
MGKDRGDKTLPPAEQTMRVRVRAKNPQIGRKIQPAEGDEETVHADPDEIRARLKSPRAPMEEESTEVALKPPKLPKEEIVVRNTSPDASDRITRKDHRKNPAPKPKGRMEMLGTEGAGHMVKQMHLQRFEDAMPQTKTPFLKPFRSMMTDQEISAVDRALSGELDSRDLRAAATSPKRSLERLIHSGEFQELVLEERAALLRAIANDPRDVETAKAAVRILESGALSLIRPHDRAHLFELFQRLTPRCQYLLADLAQRKVHGATALCDRDFKDDGILLHLNAMAQTKSLSPRIEAAGVEKSDAIAALLASVAHPEQLPLEEGAEAVLSVVEFALAECSPAECARLWRSLTMGDLVAELPGETAIELVPQLKIRPSMDLTRGDTPLRYGIEVLAGLAHPKSGPVRSAFVMPGGHGIDADVIARTLGFLYGVGFTVAAGSSAAARQLDRVGDDRWRVPPAFVSVLYEGGERLFVFDHLERDRIFLRAPHGSSSKPQGARRHDPDRVVEDPEVGLESMPQQEFLIQVGVALVPRV